MLASARSGNISDVEKALAVLADPVAVVSERGRNALHLAAAEGHPAIVKLLLEDGRIDVNAIDNMGETALFQALSRWKYYGFQFPRENYVEVIKLLFKAPDIRPDIRPFNGMTSIHVVIPIDNADVSMLDMLLKDGRIDPTIQNAYDGEPIHWAVFIGNLAAVDRLLKDNRVVPTSKRMRDGKSPLEIAYARRNRPVAFRLLEETRVMETITPEIRDWLDLTPANIEQMIAEKAWARRRHATMTFAKYWESRAAEGGKRTRRNKRRVGRRVNTVGGRRTRRNKRRVR